MAASVSSPVNLWQAFTAAVAAAPTSCALALDDGDVTFRDLEADAVRAAAWLAARNVRAGDVVALQLTKSRRAYATWLACLRQGAVYAFLDPQNPEGRRAQILNRLRPALVVTEDEAPVPDSPAPPPASVHGLSPAYVMFTSGSTGEPKGAVIAHQGVLNLMRWVRDWIPEPAAERFANLNPLHFDNSVFDLYCGLLNGATLLPVETSAAPNPLIWAKTLRRGRATVAFAVPTLFMTLDRLRLLSAGSLPEVRTFLFGGEGFPIDALRRFHDAFRGRARLVNVYGPTETSCICSSIEVTDAVLAAAGAGLASLGRMHDGFDYTLLDADERPVGRGETGELWIGGANVGLGYYDQSEETAYRFRQDPRQARYRSIWYRTGDLVREDANGLLWFQGRVDNQVKVRGHRIELEEIDLALESLPAVARAVSVVVNGADGPEIRAAFCGDAAVPLDMVRAHCLKSLPVYMQPARVVQLDILPQNANGKIDRRAARDLLQGLD